MALRLAFLAWYIAVSAHFSRSLAEACWPQNITTPRLAEQR
jgi:hypothetical protein